jgi:hypothetical protein
LLELSTQRAEKMVFASQPANPTLVRWRDGTTYITPREGLAHWAVALGMINCANRQFVDVATKISLAPNDFFNLVHNTPSGARKIGGFFARQVPIAKREAIAAPTH